MTEFINCTLGDIVTFQRGYDLPKPSMKGGIYPVVGSNGIIGYHDKYTTSGPSITIGRSGNVGKPFIYYGKTWSHNTALFVKEFKSVDPIFVYYFLKTLDLDSYAGGSAVPTLNRNHIHCLKIKIPKVYSVQQKIGYLLKTLDDKIEVNNEINQNLEQMLETIFRSWFLDSEPIPMDWEHKTFGDVCRNLKEKVLDDNRTVLSAINTGELRPSEEYFTKQVFSKDIKNYLKVPKKAFAYNPARVNIGSIGLNMFNYEGCVSPVYVVFSVEPGYEAYFNYLIKTNGFKEEVKTRASGSVRQTLSYRDLALIELTYPSMDVAQKFNELFWFIQDVKNRTTTESAKLTQLRDYLLPKLMSGELDVSELDI